MRHSIGDRGEVVEDWVFETEGMKVRTVNLTRLAWLLVWTEAVVWVKKETLEECDG